MRNGGKRKEMGEEFNNGKRKIEKYNTVLFSGLNPRDK